MNYVQFCDKKCPVLNGGFSFYDVRESDISNYFPADKNTIFID